MSTWSGRSVLVTGSVGLLGGWLVGKLSELGASVVGLDLREADEWAKLRRPADSNVLDLVGDIRDGELVSALLDEHQISAVFHLAAQTIVGEAAQDPTGTFDSNVRGTWRVLEACREAGGQIEAVVFASSDKAYGAQPDLPYDESMPLLGEFTYDASKAAADVIARSYGVNYDLPLAVTRFANLYGGGDSNQSRLVPELVAAALGGRPAVIRSDGSPERDYLYVDDAVDAYLAIGAGLVAGELASDAFNAGSGRPYSVRKLVETFASVVPSVPAEFTGSGVPDGEIDRQYVSAERLRRECGWAPKIDLATGLAETFAWYQLHGDQH